MSKMVFLVATLALGVSLAAQAQHQALRDEVTKLVQKASGRVGVAMQVLETADTLSYHDRQPYPLLSAVKLVIAMA